MSAEATIVRRILVSDVMNRKVVCISANALMAQAAALIVEHSISGLPVVDDAGLCVGILSTSDFTRRELHRDSEGHLPIANVQEILVQDEYSGTFRIEEILEDRVANHMTNAIQTISPQATVLQAARCMCLEQVHRLIVIDEGDRPVGIVSTLDVLAALVAAVDP